MKTRKLKFIIIDTMHSELVYEAEQASRLGITFEHFSLRNASPEELIQVAADADVILIDQAKFNRQVIEGLKRCKLLLRHGIGYDNVDIEACNEHAIVVGYYPTYCVRDVAEQTITLIMACQRKLLRQVDNLQRVSTGGFHDMANVSPMSRLEGKTIGIVGFGRIGQTVFQMLKGFGVKYLICDPYLPQPVVKELGEQLTDFNSLLTKADVITLHVPLKKVLHDTLYMFDTPEFEKMKPEVILINTSRGPVVNLNTLDLALREGRIAGAGIDVYETEPPDADLPILHNPKAICTPHLSWFSSDSTRIIRQSYIQDVVRLINNQLPEYQVNPQVSTYRR
jgi:D-3-phosphoglycerate dehydrogenase / 2-oxoglutarate reductase